MRQNFHTMMQVAFMAYKRNKKSVRVYFVSNSTVLNAQSVTLLT